MAFVFGPLTDVLGMSVTSTSDGFGGLILSCPKYGTLAVSSAHLANTLTAELVRRIVAAEDVFTNWRNLSVQLGLADPGETQYGSPE